jgi:2-methylcitrate dehydratase PrpD
MDGNQITAQFIAETRWEDLPDAVKEKARMCLVDNLGATLAGTLTRVSRICADYAEATWPADKATILLQKKRSSAVGAAFANAAAANGIDADDGLQYAYGHGGAQIFPVALSVGETLDPNQRTEDGGQRTETASLDISAASVIRPSVVIYASQVMVRG